MKKQRGLFEGGKGSEDVAHRLPEEVRIAVRALLAELALHQLKSRRREARDER